VTIAPDTGDLAGFRAVDAAQDPTTLVAALDEQSSLPAVQRLRAAATELLAPRRGHRIVDVGCGTGDAARALAALVAQSGAVVGVDSNESMLAEARRRSIDTSLPIVFRRGDITRLDLDDAIADATRCERVLQHLTDPHTAIVELVRITKPGGRVVVIDTDWGMHAVHGADRHLTTRVLSCWCDHAATGWSGRQLPALFADGGLDDAVVVAETLTSTDPQRATTPPITTFAAVAEDAGAVTAQQAQAWLAQLADAGTRGRFFWAVTMFAGTRR
jgi:ubiquinone/menaquinone biosynthesis C-methylase UbiE